MTIFDRVFQDITKSSELPALKYPKNTINRGELYESVLYMADDVFPGHLEKNEKVLVLLPNCPQYIISFFAIVLAGGIAVLVDYQVKDELSSIIIENNIKKVVTDSLGIRKISKLPMTNAEEIDIISSERIKIFSGNVAEIRKRRSNERSPNDYAAIFYSFGSMGKPKALIDTHAILIGQVENYLNDFAITSDDRLIAVAAFSHTFAFTSCMLAGLAAGATLLVSSSFIPGQILRLISQDKATIFYGVPFMYEILNKQKDIQQHDMSSLRFCISTGAPLPQRVSETFFQLTDLVIHQQYGSSETGAITLNQSKDLNLNILSVGQPIGDIEIRVVNKDEDGSGSLQIKTRYLAVGYLGEDPFRRDWYSTGDIGTIDSLGYVYITGREKRMINVAGLKVNPAEIESLITDYPGVIEVLVKGSKDEVYGEIIEAYIVRQDEQIVERDIIRFCQGRLSPFKVPSKVHFVKSLEKTSLGKTRF